MTDQNMAGELPACFLTSSGVETTGIYAHPAEPTQRGVILCHGFLSNKNSHTNRRLTELLISKHIATLRFDWFGMGDSGASYAHISVNTFAEQLDAAFRFLIERRVTSIGVIGSSFGGFMAIIGASKHPDLQALGLKCPVLDFPEVLRLEFGVNALEQWKRTDQIPNILKGEDPILLPYAFFEECLTYSGYEAATNIRGPTLIVHGTCDGLIPSHQIDRLYDSLQVPKQIKRIEGANHQFGRAEDFRLMTIHLADWMQEHLSPP